MTKEPESRDGDIQGELRARQKFSVAGAIGRAAGGAMKGASPIPRSSQAMSELIRFVDENTPDPSGALKSVLRRRIKASPAIIEGHLDQPLGALRPIIDPILANESMLHEFVRRVDVRWGEMFAERPHFQQPGQPPHPDDEYTHQSVKQDLTALLEKSGSALSASGN